MRALWATDPRTRVADVFECRDQGRRKRVRRRAGIPGAGLAGAGWACAQERRRLPVYIRSWQGGGPHWVGWISGAAGHAHTPRRETHRNSPPPTRPAPPFPRTVTPHGTAHAHTATNARPIRPTKQSLRAQRKCDVCCSFPDYYPTVEQPLRQACGTGLKSELYPDEERRRVYNTKRISGEGEMMAAIMRVGAITVQLDLYQDLYTCGPPRKPIRSASSRQALAPFSLTIGRARRMTANADNVAPPDPIMASTVYRPGSSDDL